MINLTVVPTQFVQNGMWFVEACLDINEILNDKKLVKFFIGEIPEQTVTMQFRNDNFVSLNDFIELLKKNKSLYNEYKPFIDWAKRDQEFMQRVAKRMYEASMMVKITGKDTKKYMKKDVSKKILDIVDYLCDRNAKEDLDVNEMASLAWERFIDGYVPQAYEE